jgi:predicted O-methyltransferase YrrM
MSSFQGIKYKDATNWLGFVPQTTTPIRYLEIGVLCGNNVLSVEKLYASHPDSVLVCVDPWIEYEEYSEYKGKIQSYYDMFLDNTAHIEDKLEIHRTFSHEALPKFEDCSFDLIYIDGNHRTHFVLEDAVLAFRKLKVGGWMVFDDYEGPDIPIGIHAFIDGFKKCIDPYVGLRGCQVFVKKTSC